MNALKLPPQSDEQLEMLEAFYQRTKDVRLKIRTQMILLAARQNLKAPQIGEIVGESDNTVRRWIKRYIAEGIEGLHDAPRPGAEPKVTADYTEKLVSTVRQRPRSLGLPFSMWTLQRLADYMAEEMGLRVSAETVRLHLKKHEIVLSRPQHKVSSPDPEYEVKKRRLRQHGKT